MPPGPTVGWVGDAELTSDPSTAAAVREAFEVGGFSAANVDALVGKEALDAATTGDLAGALRARVLADR